jgi:phasin family protein
MNTAEQVMDMQRSALATWSDLSVTAMTGAERWFTLQIDVMRSLFDGGLDQTRQMGDLDNPQNLIASMTSISKPMMDTVMSYHNESFQILQSTSLELSTILNQHWRGSATKMQSMAADSAVQSSAEAPPPFPLNTALQSIFGSAFKSPFVPDFTGPFGRVFGSSLAEKGKKSAESAKTHYSSQKRSPNNGVDPGLPGRDSHPRATATSRRAHPDSN